MQKFTEISHLPMQPMTRFPLVEEQPRGLARLRRLLGDQPTRKIESKIGDSHGVLLIKLLNSQSVGRA